MKNKWEWKFKTEKFWRMKKMRITNEIEKSKLKTLWNGKKKEKEISHKKKR